MQVWSSGVTGASSPSNQDGRWTMGRPWVGPGVGCGPRSGAWALTRPSIAAARRTRLPRPRAAPAPAAQVYMRQHPDPVRPAVRYRPAPMPSKPRRARQATRPPASGWKPPWWAPAVASFALALGWRLAYLARLARTPLADTLRGDERDYWDWATFLAGHHLAGTNPFFQGPFYPYVLALLRPLTGPDVRATL